MAIDRIDINFKPIEFIQPTQKPDAIQPKGSEGAKGSNFGEILVNAMDEVNDLQVQADQKIQDMATGQNGVTTHEAMIALEKADVAFEMMNQLRSKIIRAYEEVMRTQV